MGTTFSLVGLNLELKVLKRNQVLLGLLGKRIGVVCMVALCL